MKTVIIMHNHYRPEHVDEVVEIMRTLGAPEIRAIWNPVHEMWMAVEGCHRLRAAKVLGLTPIIIDISSDETATIDIDGAPETFAVADLYEYIADRCEAREIFSF
jgi:hypothetical protein